jgi:hypothetical protein
MRVIATCLALGLASAFVPHSPSLSPRAHPSRTWVTPKAGKSYAALSRLLAKLGEDEKVRWVELRFVGPRVAMLVSSGWRIPGGLIGHISDTPDRLSCHSTAILLVC